MDGPIIIIAFLGRVSTLLMIYMALQGGHMSSAFQWSSTTTKLPFLTGKQNNHHRLPMDMNMKFAVPSSNFKSAILPSIIFLSTMFPPLSNFNNDYQQRMHQMQISPLASFHLISPAHAEEDDLGANQASNTKIRKGGASTLQQGISKVHL